jgi:hypothetical protein
MNAKRCKHGMIEESAGYVKNGAELLGKKEKRSWSL